MELGTWNQSLAFHLPTTSSLGRVLTFGLIRNRRTGEREMERNENARWSNEGKVGQSPPPDIRLLFYIDPRDNLKL